ncbi:hypothetical protein CN285_25175 [Bacillus cereus]|nr:hypothetical protein CN285_25175 [Bacillus cereus]
MRDKKKPEFWLFFSYKCKDCLKISNHLTGNLRITIVFNIEISSLDKESWNIIQARSNLLRLRNKHFVKGRD